MKHKIFMMGAMLLMLLTTACREESDSLQSYDHNEALAFGEASTSFAGKFKVTWNGLNQYYALWDYEKEQGLDWDAVYDEYLPQFEALDNRDKDDPVTDKEVEDLLRKVLSPLHDGHFAMIWKNHVTGNQVAYSPSDDRREQRDDAQASKTKPEFFYYANIANGEIATDENGQRIALAYSTRWADLGESFVSTKGEGMMWINAEIERIEGLTIPTEMEVFRLTHLKQLRDELRAAIASSNVKLAIPAYNALVQRYAFLEVPGLDIVDPGFIDHDIKVAFLLLKGKTGYIPYFYFSAFSLTPYLYEVYSNSTFNMQNTATQKHVNGVRQVWLAWFSYIQQLHKAGTLDGIIIDVRGNGGGFMSDGQYVAGALLPAGGFQYGYSRFKRGSGRYDYSPLMPSYMATMETEHEIIDDKPVVLLINCASVSMSEMTAQVVKLMPNGTLIGKRTHGGLCGLVDNPYHSENYAGYIGVQNVTPVFGYVPSLASFTMDKQQLEGYGITPDIDVDFDSDKASTNGQDTQIDRALQFIRTGK